MRDQCAAAGVPFFYKQTGEWASTGPNDVIGLMINGAGHVARCMAEFQNGGGFYAPMTRVGKARAGRLLDGVEHNGRPAL